MSVDNENYKNLLYEEQRRSDKHAKTIWERAEKSFGLKYVYNFHNSIILNAFKTRRMTSVRLLEVGCGIGNFLTEAIRWTDGVFGIDLGLYNTRKAYLNTQFRAKISVADGKFLPFPSSCFDAVVAKGLIHHLVDPLAVIQEINRVLKPGGKFIIFEGDPQALYRRIALSVADMIGIEHEVTQFRHLKAAEIEALLKRSNFKNIRIKKISHPFIPLGLKGIGGEKLWRLLDSMADRLNNIPFNWYLLITSLG